MFDDTKAGACVSSNIHIFICRITFLPVQNIIYSDLDIMWMLTHKSVAICIMAWTIL